MNKPDWKNAPEWANYWARDMDGEEVWFENRPTLSSSFWDVEHGKCETAGQDTTWRNSLSKRSESTFNQLTFKCDSCQYSEKSSNESDIFCTGLLQTFKKDFFCKAWELKDD